MGLFKKIGKLVKKGAKLVKKVASNPIGSAILGTVTPVLGAKLASTAVGLVNRVASAPARRKATAEKKDRLNKAVAAEIARPQLQMMSGRDTAGARAMPGGSVISRPSKKTAALAMPGGASVSTMKSTVAGNAKKFAGFLSTVKAEQKKSAAVKKKSLAAEAKLAKAAQKASTSAAKKAAAAEKKLAAANKKAAAAAAKEGGGFVSSALAGALGTKLAKKGKVATIAGVKKTLARKTQSVVRGAVKKSGAAKKYLPGATVIGGILVAGGKALDANAAKRVAAAEKKLGRKLTKAEVSSVTTPVNTFAGK